MNDNDRKEALEKYLGVKVTNFKPMEYGYDYSYKMDINEEHCGYIIVTREEADDSFKESIENLIDDAGWCFGSEFPIKNYMDPDEFYDEMHEHSEDYAYDIELETDGYEPYANRFISECIERGVINENDLVTNADGLLDFADDETHDQAYDSFVESCDNDYEDSIDYVTSNFDLEELIDHRNIIDYVDLEELCSDIISLYGYEHELAAYDGEELDLGNGLYAYRYQ